MDTWVVLKSYLSSVNFILYFFNLSLQAFGLFINVFWTMHFGTFKRLVWLPPETGRRFSCSPPVPSNASHLRPPGHRCLTLNQNLTSCVGYRMASTGFVYIRFYVCLQALRRPSGYTEIKRALDKMRDKDYIQLEKTLDIFYSAAIRQVMKQFFLQMN